MIEIEWPFAAWCIIACFVAGVMGGIVLMGLGASNELQSCAQKSNVYACEFVAVPKQPDEARK